MALGRKTDATMTPGRENAQRLAQEMLMASAALSRAIEAVEEMARLGWEQIGQEEDAADKVVIEGADVARAFRVLAMRLDRAALLNMPEAGYR